MGGMVVSVHYNFVFCLRSGAIFFVFFCNEQIEEEEEEEDTIIGVETNNRGCYLGYAPTIPTSNGTYPPVVVEHDGAVPWVLGSIDRSRGLEARDWIRLDRVMYRVHNLY